jgi:F0F1-type ATP synthase delta subunit
LNHHPPFFNRVAQHYGRILSQLPKETLLELKTFMDWTYAHPFRKSMLNNKALSYTDHKILVSSFLSVVPCQSSTTTALNAMVALDRLNELPSILSYVEMLESKTIHIHIIHAQMLPLKVLSDLEKTLKKSLGQSVTIHFKNDPSLIRGCVVFAGHKMLDASLKSFFSHLKQKVDHVFS